MGLFTKNRSSEPPAPKLSKAQRAELAELLDGIERMRNAAAASPLSGVHRATVVSPKGGVGKTLTSAALAWHLSQTRPEVVAIADTNPDSGTLRRRLVPADYPVPAPIVALAALAYNEQASPDWGWLSSASDLVGRLRVFSNDGADPDDVEQQPAEHHRAFIELLSRAAQIIVQDMGTSTVGAVARSALEMTDTLVVVTDLTEDTFGTTLDYISALTGQPMSWSDKPSSAYAEISDGRYDHLAAGAVVVINPSRDPNRDPIDFADHIEWLRAVCGLVVVPPLDDHLATGQLIDWNQVSPEVTAAHMQIACWVASRFPQSNPYAVA